MKDENNAQENTDSVSTRLVENLESAERRIQGSICPIYVINARDNPKLLGSSVPFRVRRRTFLLTAAHVLDENKRTNLYVAGPEKLIALEGSSHRVRAPFGDRQRDTLDFGFIEVTGTPDEQWSRYKFVTPADLDVDDAGSEHTLYAFVGFPASKNKGPPRKEASVEYDGDGLNRAAPNAVPSYEVESLCTFRRELQSE